MKYSNIIILLLLLMPTVYAQYNNSIYDKVSDNLDMKLEDVILIVYLICGLVFYAAGFQRALMIQFILGSAGFAGMYALGWMWQKWLIVMLLHLVLMALTLWASVKSQKTYGGIT